MCEALLHPFSQKAGHAVGLATIDHRRRKCGVSNLPVPLGPSYQRHLGEQSGPMCTDRISRLHQLDVCEAGARGCERTGQHGYPILSGNRTQCMVQAFLLHGAWGVTRCPQYRIFLDCPA